MLIIESSLAGIHVSPNRTHRKPKRLLTSSLRHTFNCPRTRSLGLKGTRRRPAEVAARHVQSKPPARKTVHFPAMTLLRRR
jgi:hypothetical protein